MIGIVKEGKEALRAYILKESDLKEQDVHLFLADNGSPGMELHGGIKFVKEKLPRNSMGKILRRLFREEWINS